MNNNTYTRRHAKKKLRIKSNFRFITSLVIMFAMILGIGTAVLNINDSIALTKTTYTCEYVDQGDTLWTIAKKYKSEDTDIREAVYIICKTNDIKAHQLQAGMELRIPDNL